LWLGERKTSHQQKNRVATNAKPEGKKGKTMTNREFFEAVQNGTMNADVQAHATAEIDKMNARNEKRATTPSKTAIANEPIKAQILAFLTEKDEEILTSVIGEAVGISTSKATALCKQLVGGDKITVRAIRVPKIGNRMVWKIKSE
jgi:signal recognition particle GTPase